MSQPSAARSLSWNAADDAVALEVHARVVHQVARVGGGMLAVARAAGHRADVLRRAIEIDASVPEHAFDSVPRPVVLARLDATLQALAALEPPVRVAARPRSAQRVGPGARPRGSG